eukprot:TRINITY_DN719_c1_g1_i6.p2 TRINITY_DN719_c1_g1~~TRINITY_DN719_c1_g1_i6.p2  ORF type:complete len:124 (+),score=38.90 TRINITY_DN719_c1_g1_i6:689-1060(+)
MVTGGVLMVVGAAQILFAFLGPSDEAVSYDYGGASSDSYASRGTPYGGAELGESTFNPDDYSQPSYAADPSKEVAASYDPSSYDTYDDSLSPMQYAQAAAAGGSGGNSGAQHGSANYSAYESF